MDYIIYNVVCNITAADALTDGGYSWSPLSKLAELYVCPVRTTTQIALVFDLTAPILSQTRPRRAELFLWMIPDYESGYAGSYQISLATLRLLGHFSYVSV
ncbi:hypothetical protein PHYBLDRAFT_143594 [Phycomyces blakesleeanus NRRL 1555(-)]|uniref:Uncharacterized protein n=1 Tax=Phycomyces blakesleeanus (strain ATCC 8743b / DSM 1359 / FGSC 10004 / NBRC 33097 / NRRL 1555) TaxID=763407 RepID=A0A162PRK8_PHYB8|nr:hypothetical protein PHYBLDRAFT_143594 [Phycomyces blakesleeanus NRRL 1555(-)]OAD75337.1 hypothetical protein PHYBLDRAFT_143594 [Phycomyces blakesleeanus NRRL 1555(-)]|eukprot:XP_018293377.1 hypothetical protein PHYBLDRAFT_143594 [Phycomyces blakesleeanus NRRL 1555(-)]